MTNQTPSKALNSVLWTAQILLAVFLIMGAVMKFMPIEKIALMMPWTGQLPPLTVRLLGLLDLIGALGLLLPAILHLNRKWVPLAAIGIAALMLSAIVFHISRGEASVIGFNVFLVVIAVFIAWGRWKERR